MSDAKKASGSVFKKFEASYAKNKREEMSLTDYLELCKNDKLAYANTAERILHAIGEPEIVDTSEAGGKLNKLHGGKKIAIYPAFSEFFGMEEAIAQVVDFLKSSARGAEESRQVLHLIGPPGGGKSTLAAKLTELSQKEFIYALADKDGNLSPIQENPLALFSDDAELRDSVGKEYNIPERYMKNRLSPWAIKRLDEAGGNPEEAFKVVKLRPSQYHKIAFAQVQPGSEQNQDETELIGKPNIRKIEQFDEHDTDGYSYSGALNTGNQGVVELVEIFKASGDAVKPLLDATQMRLYAGSGSVGQIPFDGLIVSHCNEAEQEKFDRDNTNEAFKSRMVKVQVPYVMQYDAEASIYEKVSMKESYADLPRAPHTTEFLAKYNVLTRAADVPEFANYFTTLKSMSYLTALLNGDDLDAPGGKFDKDYKSLMAKVKKPYRVAMTGGETREGNKTLSKAFNYWSNYGLQEADPITVFQVLREDIHNNAALTDEQKHQRRVIIHALEAEYKEILELDMKKAFESGDGNFYQRKFDNYLKMAKAWNMRRSLNDPTISTHTLSPDQLDQKLQEIEGPANIGDKHEFRSMLIGYVSEKLEKGETKIRWDEYAPMADVLKKQVDQKFEDVLPYIGFEEKLEGEDQKKQDRYIAGMTKEGYTETMIRRAGEFVKGFKPYEMS
ncbi:MAG: hypothetical protein NZ828_05190 [Alphaproteobacteria bacterium]|nr:hypothetical protein [Alphaproteobacteria bacterium]